MENVPARTNQRKRERGHRQPQAVCTTAAPPGGLVVPGASPLYLESTFRDGELTQATLTMKEALSLNPEDEDFHFDPVFGRTSIRFPDGTPKLYGAEIPGLGPNVGLPVLDDIMWSMGEFLTVERFRGKLDDGAARASLVLRMRRAFGDSVAAEWFFIVRARPWRIAWNVARSWRIIEKLAQSTLSVAS